MKINKIAMAVITAASLLAVAPTIHAQTNDTGGAAAPRRPRGPTLESIDKAVTLTDAEKPKVKSALEDLNSAMTEARNADQSERRSKMTAARQDFDKKMKEILTPDQYTKFQAMRPTGGRRGGAGGGAGGGAPPAGGNQ
jgi:protein CpxP